MTPVDARPCGKKRVVLVERRWVDVPSDGMRAALAIALVACSLSDREDPDAAVDAASTVDVSGDAAAPSDAVPAEGDAAPGQADASPQAVDATLPDAWPSTCGTSAGDDCCQVEDPCPFALSALEWMCYACRPGTGLECFDSPNGPEFRCETCGAPGEHCCHDGASWRCDAGAQCFVTNPSANYPVCYPL